MENDYMYDYLVVGAGYAGSVIAERLASLGKKVLVIDKREHIGGNAYDYIDDAGVLVHRYGPHIFHTRDLEVMRYLSKFTSWRFYEHRVMANIDGDLYPMPINRTTINKLYKLDLDEDGVRRYYDDVKINLDKINNSEDAVISQVGRELYEKFFKHYTKKQWEMWPSQLKPEVCKRIPVRTNDDDRYFSDEYQFMPSDGYTKMFQNILDHNNIEVRTGVSYAEIKDSVKYDRLIYTGPIDEYFGYSYGKLPYRSLRFELETHQVPKYQPVATVNYPTEQPAYTRITEYKHLTGQETMSTTIGKEYPTADGDPYYVVPEEEALKLYDKYKDESSNYQNVFFIGRLAEYRYYNMDQVVRRAMEFVSNI
jgi:UDP-galactopyranose mutase